jgi:NADH dehydrogenase/NADH:ubiquinone oxidoreductase subunit G
VAFGAKMYFGDAPFHPLEQNMFGFGSKKKKAAKKPAAKAKDKAKDKAKPKKVVKVVKVVKKGAQQAEATGAQQEQKAKKTLMDIMTEKAQNDPESLASITRAMLLEEQKDANVKLKEKLAADFGIRGKNQPPS